MTYYPPPPDYYYLYSWIPSPFWYSGFFFPGYYILYDFHTVVIINKRVCVITNHYKDPRTGRIVTVHPAKRVPGKTFGGREVLPKSEFYSSDARNSARSIYERSRERISTRSAATPTKEGSPNHINPAYTKSNRNVEKQFDNRINRPEGLNNRSINEGRTPMTDPRMSRSPIRMESQRMNERGFSQPNSMTGQKRMEIQRSPSHETRPFSPPTREGVRAFSSPPQSGRVQGGSSPMGYRGFSGTSQVGGRVNSLGYGSPRFW